MKVKLPVSQFRRKLFSSLFKKKNRIFLTNKMSALDNNEIGPSVEVDLNDEPSLGNVLKTIKKKEPKRILHFSDGTMEEFDSEESDEELPTDTVESPFRKASERELDAAPPVDPKELSWPAWFKHYTLAGGSKTLSAMDRMGEGVAYYLGITTPKYQYEIDEYYRSRDEHLAEKKQEDLEFQTWNSTNPSKEAVEIITEEQKPMHPSNPDTPAVN